MRPSTPRHRAVFGIALGAILLGGPARAGEVPATAYERSVLVPGELLDQFALAFVFPELSVRNRAQIAATATSGFSSAAGGMGANLRPAGHGVFVLSQTYAATTTEATPLRLFQVGYANEIGRVRLGLAVRGTYSRRTDRDRRVVASDPSRSEEGETTTEVRFGEVALGVGVGGGDRYLDVALEVFREDLRFDHVARSSADSSSVSIRADDTFLPGVSARAGIPLGGGWAIAAAGHFRETTVNGTVDDRFGGPFGALDPTSYGHDWAAGILLQRRFDTVGLARLHLSYRNMTGPTRIFDVGSPSFSRILMARIHDEVVLFGFALEREVWWETRFLAGFSNAFRLTDTIRFEFDGDGDSRETKDVAETLNQQFAWGLSRGFQSFSLTGSMSTNLQLSALFLSLDASVWFD